MRIGIMLRSVEEDQGIGIYTRNVVPRLLDLGLGTEFVLLYRSRASVGRFGERDNVREVVLDVPSKPLWDQVAVPRAARRHGIDVLFNTKFTVPLMTSASTAMMLHGSEWFVYPQFYPRLDVRYIKTFMPLYCRKADHLISNSYLTTNDFVSVLGVDESKITTIHFAADDHFTPVTDSTELARVRGTYSLPSSFLLTVTKYYPGKNVPRLLKAFERIVERADCPLVMVGRNVDRYLQDVELESLARKRIITPGWVDQGDLPAIYSLANAFVFPSIYEGFGIPVLEAMSCGCPVVCSNTGSLPEVGGDAVLLVDPFDVEELGDAMLRILKDSHESERLRARGLDRARQFSWDVHAERTLEVLRGLS